MNIRRARRTDYDDLAAWAGWREVDASERRTIRLFRKAVSDLGAEFDVAEDDDGAAVGYVRVSYARALRAGGWKARIEELGVREGADAAKVVRALLERAVKRATRRNARSIDVEADAVADEGELRDAGFRSRPDRFLLVRHLDKEEP